MCSGEQTYTVSSLAVSLDAHSFFLFLVVGVASCFAVAFLPGKSTTIGMLTGLLKPSSGDAEIYGHSIVDDLESVRPLIGVCPQHDVLFDKLTVSIFRLGASDFCLFVCLVRRSRLLCCVLLELFFSLHTCSSVPCTVQVREHIQFYANVKGQPVDDEFEAKTNKWLEQLDLLDKSNDLSTNLSGGQKRKLSTIIALLGSWRL